MDIEETRLKFVQDTNKYISDYIKLFDAKVGGLVAIVGVVSGFTIGPVFEIATKTASFKYPDLVFVLCTLYFVSLIGLFGSALSCLCPRVIAATSLHSFPDIAKMPVDQYLNEIVTADVTKLLTAFARHNVTLAEVAVQKCLWLLRAQKIAFLWASVLLILLLFKLW